MMTKLNRRSLNGLRTNSRANRVILMLSCGRAAMGYLIYEALTTMGEIQTRRSQLMIMLAKNIIEQKSIRDHQNGQIKED